MADRAVRTGVDGRSRVGGEAAGVLGIKIVGTGLAFVAQLLLARKLGSEGLGIYALGMALLNSLLVFSRVGFDVSPLRITTLLLTDEDWDHLKGFRQVSRWVPLASAMLLWGATAVILTAVMPAGLVRTGLLTACVGLPFWTLLRVDQGWLRALGRRVTAFIPGEAVRPSILLLGIILAGSALSRPEDAPRALLIHVGAMATAAVVAALFMRGARPVRLKSARPLRRTNEWLRISVALATVTGLTALLNQVDTLLLGTLVEASDVGLFSVARRIATLLSFGLIAVNAVVAPDFARLHRDGSSQALGALVRRAALAATAVTAPLALVLVIGGRWILGWFGPEFVGAYPLLVIFSVGQVVNAACGPVALALSLTGHAQETARVMGTALGALVVGCLIFIPLYGVMGAAVTSAVVLAGWNLTLVFVSSKRLGIHGAAL